jgi:hypothetical protein
MGSSITVYKKTDEVLTFSWPTGTDLNGDTIFFTAKVKKGGSEDDSDAVISSSTTVSTSTNEAQISLTDDDTNVKPGTYQADIKRVTSGGEITGYSSFDLIVEQTVTQRSS